jgi:flagellar hook-length control protein FliK
MPVQLSDLLAPTTLPSKAGAGAPASAKSQDGAFAQELAATQAGTGNTPAAGATLSPTAVASVPKSGEGQISRALQDALDAITAQGGIKAEQVIQVKDGDRVVLTTASSLAELAPKLDLDPAIVARIQNGTWTEADAKAFVDAVAEYQKGLSADTADTQGGDALDPSTVAAAQPAPQTEIVLTTALEGNEEIALKIADEKRPYIPPRPDIPDVPAQKPVVQEGRAAATTPAPAVAPTSIETPEASSAVKTLLEQTVPRATANAVTSVETTAKAQAPTVPASTQPASAPVPPAAQAIANTPHVTSMQGTVTAGTDMAAADSAPPATTNTASPTQGTAPSAPASSVPAPAVNTADAAPESLTPPPAEGEGVDAAMAALTKDKADVKAATPQTAKPETAAPQTKPDAAATDEPEIAAQKPAETAAKPQDVKPEPRPELQNKPAEKPVVTEKPATPDAKVQQVQTPMTDKPILVDATARTTQQQMQALPAAAIQHVASEMASRVQRGHTRFEIRLDPPELGRVDVRIEVDTDGKVHSRLMVEKSETLDLLKADQRALERALQDAGFKSDQNTLSFSLKDDRGGQQKFAEQRFLRQMPTPAEPAEEPARLVADIAYRAPLRGPGGIDMRI